MSMTPPKGRFTGDVPMEKNRKQMRAAKAKAEEKTKAATAKTQEKDPTKSAQGDQDLEAKPSKDTKTQTDKTKTATGTPAASWTWPVTGKVVATFSTNKLSYNQALEDWRAHPGLDISAQVGDIVASYIKRFCSVKDYGTLFPGHGGLLDRIDGILFNAIAYCIYAMFFLL